RDVLGEDLLLPSVQTWWCGDPAHLSHVVEHFERLVIKPTFPAKGEEPIFGEKLTARERATLIATIRARPEQFVAQAHVELSTAPVWHRHHLEPRPIV